MRIVKFGHSCVRFEHEDARIVIDPGMFTEPEAVDGATAVLVTHEHPDHWTPELLRRTDAPVHTIAAVAAQLPEDVRERAVVHSSGAVVDLGVEVRVVGEKHAIIHPELPHFDNSGYLLCAGGTRVFHPGDSLTLPGEPVDLLLLPVSAPWLKVCEAIDYGRDAAAPHNVGIHDEVYSEAGHGIITGHLQRFLGERGQDYRRVLRGEEVVL